MPPEALDLPFRIPVRSGPRRRSRSKGTRESPDPASQKNGDDTSKKLRSRSVSRGASRSRSRSRASEQQRGLKRKYRAHEASASPSPDTDQYGASLGDSDIEPAPWTTCPPSEAKLHMPADIVEQYDAAGLEYHKPLPGGNFPHSNYRHRNGESHSMRMRERDVRHALTKLKPPLIDTFQEQLPSTAKTHSIKQRATASLITLMHTCLQRGDMQRADRAFSILLRLKVSNQAIDLRKDGLWGVGAEILMHRDRPQRPLTEGNVNPSMEPGENVRGRAQGRHAEHIVPRFDNSDAREEATREREAARERMVSFQRQDERLPMPTAAALSEVREYYEHLIVQFPTSTRTQSSQVSASDFYVAMYGLWLVHVDDAGKVERRLLRDRYAPDTQDTAAAAAAAAAEAEKAQHCDDVEEDGRPFDPDLLNAESRIAYFEGLQEIQEKQAIQAADLARHMDGVISSFPYSDESRLISLRASLERWLADLCIPRSDSRSSDGKRTSPAAAASPHSQGVVAKPAEEDLSSDLDEGVTGSGRDAHPASDRRSTAEMQQRRERHLKRARELADRAAELEETLHLRVRN